MCRSRRPLAGPDRTRGVALLLALVALVMVAGSSLALVRITIEDKVRRELDLDEAVAHDLLLALDEAVLAWLSQKSSSVVLPPIDAPPRIPVLRETLLLGARSAVVRIVAYDQEGMISLSVAQEEPTLAQALPGSVRAAMARWEAQHESTATDDAHSPLGLDVLRRGLPIHVRVFPESWPERDSIEDGHHDDDAVGAWIATHGAGRVHVNTAPVSVIESIYHQSGRGGFEHVIAARAKGKPVTAVPPPAYGEDALPSLVTSSHGFAFRIDLAVGRCHLSWWAVYVAGGERAWSCSQRIPVP